MRPARTELAGEKKLQPKRPIPEVLAARVGSRCKDAALRNAPRTGRPRRAAARARTHLCAAELPDWMAQGAAGGQLSQTLALGLNTLEDLLYYFPRRYDDYSQLKPINRLEFGEETTVLGTIRAFHTRPIRGGKMQMTEAVVTDGTGFAARYLVQPALAGQQVHRRARRWCWPARSSSTWAADHEQPGDGAGGAGAPAHQPHRAGLSR
jgi:hypothetical protein